MTEQLQETEEMKNMREKIRAEEVEKAMREKVDKEKQVLEFKDFLTTEMTWPSTAEMIATLKTTESGQSAMNKAYERAMQSSLVTTVIARGDPVLTRQMVEYEFEKILREEKATRDALYAVDSGVSVEDMRELHKYNVRNIVDGVPPLTGESRDKVLAGIRQDRVARSRTPEQRLADVQEKLLSRMEQADREKLNADMYKYQP